MTANFILDFNSPTVTLENAGGKGANLARLARAGQPVPGGFIATTRAYQEFVASNKLEMGIQAALAANSLNTPAGLEQASQQIHTLFEAGQIPESLSAEIGAAYRALGSPPVAVRSSATAEDLPDMSFAGQQDTYLNILGEPALLQAVVRCWASLWTGRAIGYRARQGITLHDLALAVVVQKMVPSEASGVLFTANPVSGLRSQVVIDATLGLGEALVSGQVEPDHYVVDPAAGKIVEKTLGAKALSIRSKDGGGTVSCAEDASQIQALPDEQILALARLGKQVEAEYDFPQDIEWGWAGGELHLLQSRPVTSLYPLPERKHNEPLTVWFSFGAVQGMLDPITNLGQDIIAVLFSCMGSLFFYSYTPQTQPVLDAAGMRLWARITPLLRNTFGRKVMHEALGLVEPSVQQAVAQLLDDPRLKPDHKGVSLSAIRRLLGFFPRLGGNAILNLARPEHRRKKIIARSEKFIQDARMIFGQIQGEGRERLSRQMQAINLLISQIPEVFILLVSAVASGMAPFNLLNNLARSLEEPSDKPRRGWSDLALEITRGLPNNPTTQMDLALWQTAMVIKNDPDSDLAFSQKGAAVLAQDYLNHSLPREAQEVVEKFIAIYGGRGLAEIDLGRPRWQDDPTHIMQVLGSYLQIDPELAPDVVFKRGAERAQQALEELTSQLRKTPHGWIKAHQARFAAGRVRALLGLREVPKFMIVRLMNVYRLAFLETGRQLVALGELNQPDDLFYLNFQELEQFSASRLDNARELIASRRAVYDRELKRRQIPRLLVSDGRAFYEGVGASEATADTIIGSPVSPGVVEGSVRVIRDPRGAQLQPGEILVCPGTDPSWTPLFLAAGGLVMETGGMMTHGAVVAREYGIPAVVGVHEATTRLQDGQKIRVDGSVGLITLL